MTAEEKKSLMGVDEPGHVSARYHKAIIPAGMPRVFSANVGFYPNGSEVDPAFHFEARPHLQAMVELARGDLAKFKKCHDEEVAIARRVILFHLPDEVNLKIDPDTFHMEYNDVDAEMEAERQFLSLRDRA